MTLSMENASKWIETKPGWDELVQTVSTIKLYYELMNYLF